jgi:RNA polymerase sigma-70 factor (ECF subfamily)
MNEGTIRPDPDRELVEAALAGRPGAHRALFDRYWRLVLRVCLASLPDPADAEDCAIESMARVFRGLRRFRGDALFSTWLYRVTLNHCGHYRYHAERRPALAQLSDPDLVPAGLSLEEARDQQAAVAELLAEIARLPRSQSRALVLRHVLGLEPNEVAEILGISPEAVAMRVARGRRALLRGRKERKR